MKLLKAKGRGDAAWHTYIKFIYSEKATKFCEISTVDLSYVVTTVKYGGDFTKFCGLLRTVQKE